METVTMHDLFAASQDALRTELRSDAAIDRKQQSQIVDRLNRSLEQILLRYNAAYVDQPLRQAAADCMSVTARDMLTLLTAVSAKKELEKRKVRAGAIISLLLAVITALLCVMFIREYFIPGCALLAATALFAFLGGRLWYGEREVRVRTEVDPDQILNTLAKAAKTIDRKTEEFLASEALRFSQSSVSLSSSAQDSAVSDPEELRLFADLLEALYAGNGEFALRQLQKVLPYLDSRHITVADFSPESAELFDILPSKTGAITLRPALLNDGQLLLAGRATEVLK